MTYQESWDCPHPTKVEDGEFWQESDAYWFYDSDKGIGGFHRIGQKPNINKGQLMLFAFKEGGQRFVLSDGERIEVDLGPGDRQETRQIVGSHVVEALGEGRMRYTWDEPESSAELEFYESFYEPRDWSKTGHSKDFMNNINADGHLECSGRLRGTIRIGDETEEIDALAHRDRSWGLRDNSRASMHRYRMFSGTCGPELSFACFLLDLKDGMKMVAGFANVDGEDLDVKDLRVICEIDYDGYSVFSSTGILTLENGRELRLKTQSVQGFMTPVPEAESVSQDHISTFTWNGKLGFMDLEHCNNPGKGSYVPTQDDLSLSTIQQGLSKFVDYKF